MDPNSSLIIVLEEKIIGLLNKLKENHLSLFKEEELRMNLLKKNKSLEEKVVHLQNENKLSNSELSLSKKWFGVQRLGALVEGKSDFSRITVREGYTSQAHLSACFDHLASFPAPNSKNFWTMRELRTG